jgi:hypothetical protein
VIAAQEVIVEDAHALGHGAVEAANLFNLRRCHKNTSSLVKKMSPIL